LELDLNFIIIKKRFIIYANEILDVWTSKPTTLRSVARIGGIPNNFKGLKLDLADLFEHVGLECNRPGHFQYFFFAPVDPPGFMNAIKVNLLHSPKKALIK